LNYYNDGEGCRQYLRLLALGILGLLILIYLIVSGWGDLRKDTREWAAETKLAKPVQEGALPDYIPSDKFAALYLVQKDAGKTEMIVFTDVPSAAPRDLGETVLVGNVILALEGRAQGQLHNLSFDAGSENVQVTEVNPQTLSRSGISQRLRASTPRVFTPSQRGTVFAYKIDLAGDGSAYVYLRHEF
jgi:hypothetical protein